MTSFFYYDGFYFHRVTKKWIVWRQFHIDTLQKLIGCHFNAYLECIWVFVSLCVHVILHANFFSQALLFQLNKIDVTRANQTNHIWIDQKAATVSIQFCADKLITHSLKERFLLSRVFVLCFCFRFTSLNEDDPFEFGSKNVHF